MGGSKAADDYNPFKGFSLPRTIIHGWIACNCLMSLDELATLLVSLGCPPNKSAEMASQLDKRAKQLASEKNRTYDDTLAHLLELMRQGWAAKEKGF